MTLTAQAGMIQSIILRYSQRLFACWVYFSILGLTIFLGLSTHAQGVAPMALIPDTAAGAVRIPDMPEFCEAWKTTTLSAFANDPSMKSFVDAQRTRAEQELFAANLKVGVKLRDLLEIASGEAVIAWLPFKDPKRPYSIAIVADTSKLQEKAQDAIDQVDKDLIASGAKRTDSKYGDDIIRVYVTKPQPGQLKIDEVAIMLNKELIIASDRESVVTGLLDAVAGKSDKARLIDSRDYTRIASQVEDRTKDQLGGVIGFQWFARPLAMARIVKDAVGIDRGRQVDVLNLLERQGFDAVTAAGGQLTIGNPAFDLLHHGFVLAPPVTKEPSKYKLAARMLQFPNIKNTPIPPWVGSEIASYTRLNWRMDEAFWAAETLVNDAFGDEIFRDIFDGIRDDEDGPRIDVQKNVIPNLGDHMIVLTDNKMPADESSERMLVAIRITNLPAFKDAVKRAMEVEPDAKLVEGTPGVDVYLVRRSNEKTDFDAELFNDLGLDDQAESETASPLLNQWAITVTEAKGESGGYLVFASHPEFLTETVTRMMEGKADGAATTPEFQDLEAKINQLGGTTIAMKRVVRPDLSLRVKYQLLREGRLRDSDSLLSSIFRRISENADASDEDPINAKTLPSLDVVEKYFRPAGTFLQTRDDGWQLDGFLLK